MATHTVIDRYLAVLLVKKATVFTVAFCYLEPDFIYSQSRITLPESPLYTNTLLTFRSPKNDCSRINLSIVEEYQNRETGPPTTSKQFNEHD